MSKPETRPESKSEVVVIGAGFSGLVAARKLAQDGYKVTVVEKSSRIGGLISSRREPQGLVETAANGLLCSKEVEDLFSDCGLEIQIPNKSANRRYLAVDREVFRWPLTFFETVCFAFRAFRARRKPPKAKESLAVWAHRVLGEAPAVKLVAPAMLGIYAATADQLSADLIVGRMFSNSRRNVRGRIRGTVTAPGGMGELMASLRKFLEAKGVIFKMTTDGRAELEAAQTKNVPVVVATSAWDAAILLGDDPRSSALKSIVSIPLISLTLFFKNPPPRRGFGTLFSQDLKHGEKDGILGCLQNSEIFSGRVTGSVHSETWILGGSELGPAMIDLSDAQLIEMVLDKRTRLIDAKSNESLHELSQTAVISRWPRAIPMYSVELSELISDLRRPINGVVLFGNYLGDLGLASILESTKGLSARVREL